jgi:hypothetical protein
MPQKFITKAIVDFLKGQRAKHPGQDLLDHYLKYGAALETQINVASGNGEPVHGKRATWTDGVDQWWNVRIPRNAMAEPTFKDYKLSWPLEEHAEGIGSTGWDWKERCSRYFGFDFDALTGHAKGVGIDDEQLKEVQKAAEALPYVEVRKSTGGKGIHLYVYVDAVPTDNHTEHAALARCVLGMMSSETGFDFASQIDCCGGVMWVWHRKLTEEDQGLALLKPAEKTLGIDDLPSNWKDHIEVVRGKRSKVRIEGINDKHIDPFDQLASARRIVQLDEEHKSVIDELARSGYSTVWVSDHHLVQTHTCALQRLLDDPDLKAELNLKGFYSTTSEGRDKASPNCFMFPLPDGAFKVYRFSPGISEANTWQQDGEGWTTCFFNHEPDLKTASRALGGAELDDDKGFQFDDAKDAIDVAEALGEKIAIEDRFLFRETILRPNKDGRLIMRVKKEKDETKPSDGWAKIRGDWWEKVFGVKTDPTEDQLGMAQFDERLRTLVTPQAESAGWFVQATNGKWNRRAMGECKNWLQNQGLAKTEAEEVLGGCVNKPWELVNLPFQDEYPGGRRWNYNSPQFKYPPAQLKDDESPVHPHWDKVLQHCFCDLDDEIRKLHWAQEANIRNGYQYGLAWISCCFRDPFEPLPFLFFFGNQNSGKSIFHEALSLLVTGGVVSADRALTNNNNFNGELATGVLAVVEEKNIAGSSQAYNRIKEWVTSKVLWVRKMRMDAYPQPNTLHFVMMANEQEACPVIPGDTRIMVIEVPDLLDEQEIPKLLLLKKLEEEAPQFMKTLMDTELPEVHGRLRLPVVDTEKRKRSQEMHRSPLEMFIAEQCHYAPGQKILFAEFFERFMKCLDPAERFEWSKPKVSRSLPSDSPSGASGGGNQRYVGNLSWDPCKDSNATPYICANNRLKLKED